MGRSGIGQHFDTGTVEQTKLYINNARSGLFDPNIGVNNWTLEGWSKFHLNLNRFVRLSRSAGRVAIGLDGAIDIGETVSAYHEFGWSRQFGLTASENTGDFLGSYGGGVITSMASRKVLEKGGEQLIQQGFKSLLPRLGVNFAGDVAAEGVACEVALGAATILAPEVLAAGAAVVLVVGLSYYASKFFAKRLSELGGFAFDEGCEVYQVLKKGYHKWL